MHNICTVSSPVPVTLKYCPGTVNESQLPVYELCRNSRRKSQHTHVDLSQTSRKPFKVSAKSLCQRCCQSYEPERALK